MDLGVFMFFLAIIIILLIGFAWNGLSDEIEEAKNKIIEEIKKRG